MHIITISRQFGSGGREVGKRLADELSFDYYDKEIIETLAEDEGLEPDHVRKVLSGHGWQNVQLTYKNSFSHLGFDHDARTRLLKRQREVIEEIANLGNDCIIVGRDADILLEAYRPFRVFICADMDARLARCLAHEESRPEEERLSEKEILKNIRRIDKNRAYTREILTGKRHSDSTLFDLTINAAGRSPKQLAKALAAYAREWFM